MIAVDSIRFRCSPDQKKSFESKALSLGMSLSAWIILQCEAALEEEPEAVVATAQIKRPAVATNVATTVATEKPYHREPRGGYGSELKK